MLDRVGDRFLQIVREGQIAPDGNGTFSGAVSEIKLNNIGQVAFEGILLGTNGGSSDNGGIFRGNGGALTQIAREGQGAPDGNGTFSSFNVPELNDSGQAAFRNVLIGTSGGSTDIEGIFRGSGGALTQIVRGGQHAPDGNGFFQEFSIPLLNNSGQTAFLAALNGTSGGVTDDIAIFVSDGIEVLQAVREGDAVAGSVVTFIDTSEMGFNDPGQISYKAILQNDNLIINRWTPELHWRTEGDGHWDSGVNWTLSLNHGDVHDVFIDPSMNSFITGPSPDVALRSLSVGGGSGEATLNLTGAELAASESIIVATNGVISGIGQLNSVIFVDGTLAPGDPIGTLDAHQSRTLAHPALG